MNLPVAHRASLLTKIVAGLFAIVLVVLGLAGLVLPLLPGLLLLAIAAVVVTRHFPSTGRMLRKNRALNRHLDKADGFFGLTLWDKTRLCGLVCARTFLAAATLIVWTGGRVANLAAGAYRRHRTAAND